MLYRFGIFIGLGSVVATIIYFTPIPDYYSHKYFIQNPSILEAHEKWTSSPPVIVE
ncbi:hypothetical protein EAG_14443 [Camponotus floridanus]|uniref:Uncharacterized protein n=1 Tax=Camponotus floridanus TaxID=104421 RepID=E2ANM2_CAMFO|nr:hypothetical protein EAG_14443 [Camponotus floridanus]